jgi:outer membrane protein, multidrug efflux system
VKNKNIHINNGAALWLSLLFITIFFGSCLVGPKYERPEFNTPEAYANTNEYVNPEDSILNLKWFDLFHDSTLTQLIDTALVHNYDLKIAISRMEQAQSVYGFNKADQLPSIGYSASASRTELGDIQFDIPAGNNFNGVGTVFWEIDLWGRVRHSKRGALNDYLATVEAKKSVQSALISDLTGLYFTLRDIDNKIEISKRTSESRRQSYDILKDQFQQGYVAELDVLQVEQLLRDAEAAIPAFERERTQIENAINILLGKNNIPINRGITNAEQLVPPVIPSGLPSSLLANRPDVQFAEYRYMAENERIGVTIAQRFPTISLTGFLGVASTSLSTITSADALTSEISGSLVGPIFNFGKNKRRVEIQRKEAEVAMYDYKKSYITAFAEVENALVACDTYTREFDARNKKATASFKALSLSQARYDNGYTAYLEVLDAQRSMFNSELDLSTVRRLQLSSYIQLYKALGGGW